MGLTAIWRIMRYFSGAKVNKKRSLTKKTEEKCANKCEKGLYIPLTCLQIAIQGIAVWSACGFSTS